MKIGTLISVYLKTVHFSNFFELIEFLIYLKIFRVGWVPHVLSSGDFCVNCSHELKKMISKILAYFGIGLFILDFKNIWGWLLHVLRFWNIFLLLWHQLNKFPEKSWCTLKLVWLYWFLKIFTIWVAGVSSTFAEGLRLYVCPFGINWNHYQQKLGEFLK